jgi:hypothetical protein
MIKYLQLPFLFDAARMLEELHSPALKNWQLHYQEMHYEGNWSAIPLRSVDGLSDSILVSPREDAEYKDTIFLDACPYIREVLYAFHCPLQAVRLLRLDTGAFIKEHRDAELNFEKGEIRLHITVITHEQVEFYLAKERLALKEGECWYMNFNLPHSIQNNSPVNRVHLVIDAVVNDWVKELFASPAITIKKEIAGEQHSAATLNEMIHHLRKMNNPAANSMADNLEKELALRTESGN